MTHTITHSSISAQILAGNADTLTYSALVILIAIMIITLLVATYRYICKKVKETSLRYQAIFALNDRTVFGNIKSEYIYKKALGSKKAFDNYNSFKFLQAILVENMDFYTAVLTCAVKNENALRYYETSISEAPDLMPISAVREYHVPFLLYRPIERTLCKKLIQQPVTTPAITISISYRSPKGRNFYQKDQTYEYRTLKNTMDSLQRSQALRAQASYERSQMSRSLRYDILKRDHFRCVLCGSSSQDGVKLHIDHIVPVSKGGRTVPENLRTLCEHCNIGKSDKYDAWGKN